MQSFDWSRFSVRINIKNATVEKLYQAWATREGLEYWFLRLAEFKQSSGTMRKSTELLQKGDTYSWRWFGHSDDITEKGEIIDCNGKDYFSFGFGDAGICTIRILEEEGEKIVELVQNNIPIDDKAKINWHIGCKTGWTFYLANLKSLFEGGIDLRNKNEKIHNVLTA